MFANSANFGLMVWYRRDGDRQRRDHGTAKVSDSRDFPLQGPCGERTAAYLGTLGTCLNEDAVVRGMAKSTAASYNTARDGISILSSPHYLSFSQINSPI